MKFKVIKMSLKGNVHEAKTQFPKLLKKVGNREEVVISKAGKPVARLIAINERPTQRIAGSAKEKVFIAKDFDAPLPEFLIASTDRTIESQGQVNLLGFHR
jgi:prevent-host-death family protein